ncbi:MAG: hypothetical protein P1U86_18825 [Verrucomicrobiales bacterium]|nr:hypothetical protein [Verrucomicrobiales bacterium]
MTLNISILMMTIPIDFQSSFHRGFCGLLCGAMMLIPISGPGEEEGLPLEAGALADTLSSTGFLIRQRERTADLIAGLEGELEMTSDEDDRDDIEDRLEVLNFLSRELGTVGSSESERVRMNANAARILASVTGEEPSEKLPPFNVLFRHIVWGSLFGHGIPTVKKSARDLPSGESAISESPFLYDPTSRSFYGPAQLSAMSPNQISTLDIDPHHPAWLSWSAIETSRTSRLTEFESEMQRGMTRYLQSEGDLPHGHSYSLSRARRVLFLEEVYLSATSPKADTEDAYGVEWKLKWGDEPAVEPVASRLYLLAGGRETDLVFANGAGKAGTTLILNEKGTADKDEEEDDERHAATVEELKSALLDFYGFDLEPYIYESGTITEGNVSEVLGHLATDGEEKYRPGKLIGRDWVTFKESGVELDPKGFIRREDGAPLADAIARNDRVYRGLYLFDLWIENGDVKDGNQKAFYRAGPDPGGEWQLRTYAEGHHDMGLSFGGLFSSGETNRFRAGNKFAYAGANKLRFKGPVLYKPKSWLDATWADGKWMARHIAAIPESQIREAVAASLWPDFVQEVLVYRLLSRRNRIAELFEIDRRGEPASITAPSLSVALDSEASRAALEKRYGLPAGALAAEMRADRPSFRKKERIVRNGVIASHEDSLLMRALVRHRYPSGIVDRYRRHSDRSPLAE